MINDENEQVEIRLESSDVVHIPSAIQFAQHQYAHGVAANTALETMRDLFDFMVSDEALITVLTGERNELYIEEDFDIDARTYVFTRSELAPAYQDMDLE